MCPPCTLVLRSQASTAVRGVIFADLCAAVGLTNVGVVADWSDESQKLFSQPTADVFVDAVAEKKGGQLKLAFNDRLTNVGTRDEEVNQVVQRLLASGVRVVYVATLEAPLKSFVCATHKQLVQHTGPNHNGVVWMTDLSYIETTMTDAGLAAVGCTREEWAAASRGVLGATSVIFDDGTASPEPGGKTPAAWYAEYKKRAVTYNTAERPTTAISSPYAETNYDAVWLVRSVETF